jgi:hypothetical protein
LRSYKSLGVQDALVFATVHPFLRMLMSYLLVVAAFINRGPHREIIHSLYGPSISEILEYVMAHQVYP